MHQLRTIFIAFGPSFLLDITLMGSKALVQLVPISNSMLMFRFSLITSSATHGRCFHFFSFWAVATSQESTGRSFLVYVFGKLIHSWFKPIWLQPLRPSKAKVVWFSSPFKILTVMDVFWPLICRVFMRLTLTKHPWLQLSNIAKVL